MSNGILFLCNSFSSAKSCLYMFSCPCTGIPPPPSPQKFKFRSSRLSMVQHASRPASGPYWWHRWTSAVSRSQPRRSAVEGLFGWVNSSTEEFMTIIVLTARKLVFSLHLKIPRDTSWRPLVCDSIQNSPEIPSAFRHHVPKWERAERRLGVHARFNCAYYCSCVCVVFVFVGRVAQGHRRTESKRYLRSKEIALLYGNHVKNFKPENERLYQGISGQAWLLQLGWYNCGNFSVGFNMPPCTGFLSTLRGVREHFS